MVICLCGFAALLLICVVMLHGLAWIAERVLPWLMVGVNVGAVTLFVVLLPLSFFRSTRTFSANCMLVASYLFGMSTWLYGFLVTYTLWGAGALFLGLFLGIVGVVPLGILAAAFKSQWWIVFNLIWLLGLTYGSRLYSVYLSAKDEKQRIQDEILPELG